MNGQERAADTGPPGASHSVHVIAKLFDLTPRRVQQLAREGIVPKPQRGRYDLIGCIRGYTRYLQERAFGADTADLQKERGRLLKAQADRAEILVDEIRGALIAAEELERVLEFFATSVRSRLLAVPRKLAVKMAPENPRDAEAILETEIHAILEELANDETLPEWLAETRRGGARARKAGVSTASQSNGQRVGGSKRPAS